MPACQCMQSPVATRPVKLLFLGDIMGRSGRTAITTHLPRLREELGLDFVVANSENADHAFDNRDMLSFVEKQNRVIRPINIAKTAPGVGARLFDAPSGRKVLVAQVLGQVFMKQPYADPFSAIETALRKTPLGRGAHAVLVDFHAEATSEKMAMGHWLDGKASLVVGTHTHVPTADLQILPKGTAFQSDAGMCGCAKNGLRPIAAKQPFAAHLLKPITKAGWLCARYHSVLAGDWPNRCPKTRVYALHRPQ